MITQENLKQVLDYDIGTDNFIWKNDVVGRKPKQGDIATQKFSHKCPVVFIDSERYNHNKLLELYYFGHYPKERLY